MIVRTRRSGYTLLEVVISTMLVSIVLVGAMDLAGASLRGTTASSRKMQAALLANDLLGEILQQQYIEPDDTPAFGVEGSELSTARTLWDDVDDYRNWDESPLREKDGTVIPDSSDWRRWTEIKHVAPNSLTTDLLDTNDQGVKRITVSVSYDGELLVSLTGIHTEAWIDMIPQPGNDRTTGSKPNVNQPPTAVAAGSPTSGTDNVTVNFNGTGSTDPNGDPLSYFWDFADGTTSTASKPTKTLTHYTGTRVFNVTLTVTDIYGATDTDMLAITVY